MSDLELLQNLTESGIEPWFEPAVLLGAMRLYQHEHVYAPVRQGTTLVADVLGSDGFYYDVAIAVTTDGIRAGCDCESEHFCEHIGAVLLNWIHAPQDFKPDDDALSPGFLDYLQELIADLEGEEPGKPDDHKLAFRRALPNLDNAKTLAAQTPQLVEQELRELLWKQTVQQLRATAHRRGWKLRGTHKDGLVDQLVQFYLDATDTAGVIEALDDDRRLAIEFLALRASVAPVPESLAKTTICRQKGRRSEKEASAILQDLQELGLVFAARGYGGTTYRTPAAIARQLPPWPNLLTPFAGAPAKLDVRQSPPFALTQVVYQVWQYLQESPTPKKARALPKPTQLERQWPPLQGWLNPPDELAELERLGSRFWHHAWQHSISVRLFPPALSDADLAELRQRTAATDDILDFAFNLLTSLGLIRWKYGTEIQINDDGMTAFLTYPDADRLGILTTAWMRLDWWSEVALVLRHVRHLRLRRSLGLVDLTYDSLIQELAQARMVVIVLLRRLSPGRWYRTADFRRLLRRFWPDYLHTASTSPAHRWWLETAGSDYKLSPDKAGDWEAGYAPFVTACLEGPLAWLGVVRLGYDRQGLAAFQLTDLGAYLLGLRESFGQAEKESPGPALIIHGDGTVVAHTGYATTGAYDVLNVAARLQETSAQQFRYRITADSAQHAFEQGWTGQAILDELEKHSGDPVPEPLRGHILNWAEGYGQVHLYDEVTLIEFADDFVLQELLASTSLAKHLVYQFSPRLVAIKAEAVDALRDELVRLGHTPRIE